MTSNDLLLKYPLPPKLPAPYEYGYHHEKFLKNYKGCNVEYPKYLTLEEVETFEASPKDIAVCAFPKSGTTWMNAIVQGILGGGDRKAFHDAPLEMKSPFMCRCEPEQPVGTRPIDILKKKPPGRTFFTHLSYPALPASIVANSTKKIYIYRNPKDTIISLFHFLQTQRRIQFHGDLDEVIDSFITDHVEFGPYFDHLGGFWRRRSEDPDLFICSFEELKRSKKSFHDVVAALTKFLDKELSSEQIDVIHHETDFPQFQANPMLNKSKAHEMGFLDFNKSEFIRNGTVGQWKTVFTPDQNKRVDAWITKSLQRPDMQGLVFEYE